MEIQKSVSVGDKVNIAVNKVGHKGVAVEDAVVASITGSTLSAKKHSLYVTVDMSDKNTVITVVSKPIKRFLVFYNGLTSNIAYDTAEEAHEAARACYGNNYKLVALEGQWHL